MQQETDGSKLSKKTQSKKQVLNTRRWSNRLNETWFLALLGAVFYWFSLPPMKFPWAGFLASACWVAIIAKECPPTRREYWRIWLAGALLWLALLQGIRLAYWPLHAGWIALSLYLAVYLPIFVAMARSLNRSWYLPLPFATATAWVGCELIRAYFVTGFAACMLAHSQTPWPWMLPVASYFGSYGVSFVVMFTGAVLYQWLSWAIWNRVVWEDGKTKRFVIENSICTVLAVVVALGSIGSMRSHDQWIASQEPIKPLCTVLLIQENMPTQFDGKADDMVLGWKRYEQQTAIAAQANASKSIDLVVWPESTFSGGPDLQWVGMSWLDWNESYGFPPDLEISETEFIGRMRVLKQNLNYKLQRISAPFQSSRTVFLLGTDVLEMRTGKTSRYNAALWVEPNRSIDFEYYAKQHLVLFGEYIPLVSSFPSLLSMIGLGQLEAGDKPMGWRLPSGATISTSICFEDVLPHLIHSHVRQLTAMGKSPDMLVNITNDGWFRDSSILDHHLNNAILAAVENRRPMLVAANLGISAWIDGDGRVVRSLQRMEAGSILAEPIPDGRWGWWQSVGDWPARFLAIVSCLPFCVGVARRFLTKRPSPNGLTANVAFRSAKVR